MMLRHRRSAAAAVAAAAATILLVLLSVSHAVAKSDKTTTDMMFEFVEKEKKKPKERVPEENPSYLDMVKKVRETHKHNAPVDKLTGISTIVNGADKKPTKSAPKNTGGAAVLETTTRHGGGPKDSERIDNYMDLLTKKGVFKSDKSFATQGKGLKSTKSKKTKFPGTATPSPVPFDTFPPVPFGTPSPTSFFTPFPTVDGTFLQSLSASPSPIPLSMKGKGNGKGKGKGKGSSKAGPKGMSSKGGSKSGAIKSMKSSKNGVTFPPFDTPSPSPSPVPAPSTFFPTTFGTPSPSPSSPLAAPSSLPTTLLSTQPPTSADEFNPNCPPTVGGCIGDLLSLNQVLTFAPAGSTIAFCPGDLTLMTEMLLETSNMTLCCAGITEFCNIIAAPGQRVLQVTGDSVTIQDLRFFDGMSPDPGGNLFISAFGNHRLIRAEFFNGESSTAGGNAYITAPDGTLTVEDSVFSDGSAVQQGGGMVLDGMTSVSITGSVFTNNISGEGGGGGLAVTRGVDTASGQELVLLSNQFEFNQAILGGGFVLATLGVDPTISIASNIFLQNTAAEGGGAGVFGQTLQEITLSVQSNSGSANTAGDPLLCNDFLAIDSASQIPVCIGVDENFTDPLVQYFQSRIR